MKGSVIYFLLMLLTWGTSTIGGNFDEFIFIFEG